MVNFANSFNYKLCIYKFWSCNVHANSKVLIFFLNAVTDGCSFICLGSEFHVWSPVNANQFLNWEVQAGEISKFNLDSRRSCTFKPLCSVNLSVNYKEAWPWTILYIIMTFSCFTFWLVTTILIVLRITWNSLCLDGLINPSEGHEGVKWELGFALF